MSLELYSKVFQDVNLHIRCTYNIIIVMHCVLLPPITSVHLASFESTYNYIYAIARSQSAILEKKLGREDFSQACLKKDAGNTMQHIFAFIWWS